MISLRTAALGPLLEADASAKAQAALEGLREAILLGAQVLLDDLAVLLELGVPRRHLLAHDVGEGVRERAEAAKAAKEYDVIIVGSGAGGGQMAYTLTLAGIKCVMLEAGRNYDPVKETPMFQNNSQAPLRAAGTPAASAR